MDDAVGDLEIRWIRGFPSRNVEFVDEQTVCYTCGSHICFVNLETKRQSVFEGPGRGVGAMTANGNSGVFAFSEQRLSPSIFVYIFPELQLKNELKGTAELDYTSLTLSDGGPFLGCCSAFPDHTITVWDWENAEPLCTQPQAGQDVISLVFNPLNWLQLCALGTSSLTLWNIEKSASAHVLKPSVVELPAADGSSLESLWQTSEDVNTDLTYYGPEIPPSAIAGCKGEKAEGIVTQLCAKARLTPTALCWTTTSELCVGCEEGFLLLVDTESLSVAILYNPATPDAIPEIKQSSFQALAPSKNGLIAVGEGGVVHSLQIKDSQIDLVESWKLEVPIITVMCSPDYETLLLSSCTGQFYVSNLTGPENIAKILDVLNGNFVAAAFLQTDKNICVSVRESGTLQLWSADGICLSSLPLQAEVTSLACCPIAQYAAVGTASGSVLLVDLNKEQQPRLVHQVHLYHTSVDHLVFDQSGHYLITGASDSHVYVLDAKPSRRFSVVGYTVVPGPVLSLSTQSNSGSKEVKVLALTVGAHDKPRDGSLLTVLTLPTRELAGPGCVDQHGRLSDQILKMCEYKVPHPVRSCVLGVGDIFAYCQRRKTLQRFQLPQFTESPSDHQMVQLRPVQEIKGHPLGPASLALSPHQLLLASAGRDGLLRIRETTSMERHIERQCHSCRLGGVGSVSFSPDGGMLLTAGVGDGSLVCSRLRIQGLDAEKVSKATQYIQSMACFLKEVSSTESSALSDLPEWGREPPAGTEKPEGSEVRGGEESVAAVIDQEEIYKSLHASPSSHPTWLESRRAAVMKEESLQYSETKKNLRKKIQEMRDIIQDEIRENESVLEIEHLELHEFNLDVEEQRRLDEMVEQEITKVRNEIEMDILEKCYLRDVLKRECWDSMKLKGRAVKAFHSEHEVKNYPFKERTEKELEDLRRVENMRMLENAACALQQSSRQKPSERVRSEEDREAESALLTGSYSAQLGCSHPYLYDQLSVQTTEQKINQIILLQDLIYRVKTAFNAEFDAVHRQKVQEVGRVRDRNRQIREIMAELDTSETLWEPALSDSEWPERLFTVDDSEIKTEKCLTPGQREEEQRKKLEEELHLAAKGDNFRGRALDDMMDGVLDVKKEGFLKVEVPPPEFVWTKPDVQWSEEEKKAYKEHEKKTKELSAEKEKYRKILETEMKKLQASTKDATERFDETLKGLFERKIRCEMAVHQEELKITYLVYSVHMEEVMRQREMEVKLKHEKMLAYKRELEEEVRRHESEVESFQEAYESVAAEDKVLDKDFRREFIDVPRVLVDQLYKLFKRRPRVKRQKAQTDINDQSLCASLASDWLGKIQTAMEELDAPENMPEGLHPSAWERFCLVRRTKAASEQEVREKALTLAEMRAFLQKRTDENNAAQLEIKNLSEEIESLHKKKNYFLMDIMVQALLKQGQVEVSAADLIPDYSNSVLLHRSVVEDLNTTIRTLGEQKIATMVETKDCRKGIIQLEWKNKMTTMQIEDLKNKARDIQMLRLSEDQKGNVNKTGRDSWLSKQVSILRETIAFQEKTHLKDVQQREQRIRQLNMKAAVKARENAVLNEKIQREELNVSEIRFTSHEAAPEENQAAKTEEHYQEILQRRKLKDTAGAQMRELAFLIAEVERLRMKNFPSLDQLKYN